MPGVLYYGDNLAVLREHIPDASVDLIYLDPPFNSNATYNVLFRSPKGERSVAQIQAFDDTWHWGEEAETAYDDVMQSGSEAAGILRALRSFLRENDLMAYLAMMAVRLIEMHRVLRPAGTLYLHCDPTASHYLKVMLDGIFGAANFRNEIIWQRTTPKGHSFTRFPSSHDVILCFGRSPQSTWNAQYLRHSNAYIKSHYGNVEEGTGRRYMLDNCLNPNRDRPNLTYEWNGHVRVWRWTQQKMQALHDQGRLAYTKSGMPRYKRYLDEMKGTPVTSVWTDIPPINSQAAERLGYPTQKPLALLERIIQASSNPGDLILDPFCGCGTAVHAAESLGRSWIGIDVTHIAIQIIEERLRRHFPILKPTIIGRPQDLDAARDLARRDKYQFQWWATWLARGHPRGGLKKGADRGVDGDIWFKYGAGEDGHAVISVKGGANLSPQMIRDLRGVRERENAEIGIFVCLDPPTAEMNREAASVGFLDTPVGRFPRIQIFTVADLLAGYLPKLPPVYDTVTAAEAGRKKVAKARQSVRGPSADQREMLYPFAGGIQQNLLFAAEPRPQPLQETVEAEVQQPKRRRRRSRRKATLSE